MPLIFRTVMGKRSFGPPPLKMIAAWRTSPSGTAETSTSIEKAVSPPAGMVISGGTVTTRSSGASTFSFSVFGSASTLCAVRVTPTVDATLGTNRLGVFASQRWLALRLEVGRGRVERDRDVGGPLDREPARAGVEGIEGRRPVLVDELPGRGERHERRLDLPRRPARVERPHQRRRAGDVRARHRRPLRSPGRARPRGVGGVDRSGVLPARICTPGAVMSGLPTPSSWSGPPRELKAAIRSRLAPWPFRQ